MFEPLFIVFNHIICLDLGKIREKFTRKSRLKFSNASTDKQGFCWYAGLGESINIDLSCHFVQLKLNGVNVFSVIFLAVQLDRWQRQ